MSIDDTEFVIEPGTAGHRHEAGVRRAARTWCSGRSPTRSWSRAGGAHAVRHQGRSHGGQDQAAGGGSSTATPRATSTGFNGVYHDVVAPERIVQTFEFEGTPEQVALETVTLVEAGGADQTISPSPCTSRWRPATRSCARTGARGGQGVHGPARRGDRPPSLTSRPATCGLDRLRAGFDRYAERMRLSRPVRPGARQRRSRWQRPRTRSRSTDEASRPPHAAPVLAALVKRSRWQAGRDPATRKRCGPCGVPGRLGAGCSRPPTPRSATPSRHGAVGGWWIWCSPSGAGGGRGSVWPAWKDWRR